VRKTPPRRRPKADRPADLDAACDRWIVALLELGERAAEAAAQAARRPTVAAWLRAMPESKAERAGGGAATQRNRKHSAKDVG
jgi:hypothetical protein